MHIWEGDRKFNEKEQNINENDTLIPLHVRKVQKT